MKGIKISQSITDRSNEIIRMYFRDVSKIPLITAEEEKELAYRAKDGDKRAIDKLVISNLRFVISVAKQYQGRGIDLLDLIQEGSCGVVEAVKHYDPSKGFKFISYAVWWIRQAIVRAISNQCRTVRLPVSQIVGISKINKATEKFEQEYGRKPSIKELEEETGFTDKKINKIMYADSKSVSLDSPIREEDASCLVDIIANPNSEETDKSLIDPIIPNEIEKLLKKLPNRDSDVLRMFYGIRMIPMSSKEIANRFGISSERVRQIQHNALNYIRANYKKQLENIL